MTKQTLFFIGLSLVCLAVHILIPVWQWDQAHILIHDNLDSSFVYYELLAQNDALLTLSNISIHGILGEVPAWTFGRLWGYRILRSLMDPLAAYHVFISLQALVAYGGMFLFCRSYLLLPYQNFRDEIASVVALSFATLPFWPFAGLSVAGLPFVAAIFCSGLGLQKRISRLYIIFLVVVGLFSIFVLSWLFFIPLAVCVLMFLSCRHGWEYTKIAWAYLGIFIIVMIATRWIEFAGTLLNAEPSIRSEFFKTHHDMIDAITTSIKYALNAQYHVESFHTIAFPLIAILGGLLLWKRQWPSLSFVAFIGITGLACVIYGFYLWEGLAFLKEKISLLNQLNWSRIHWLTPFFWWSIIALCLSAIAAFIPQHHKKVHVGFAVILCIIMAYQYQLHTKKSDFITEANRGEPSFTEFFAPDMFATIRDDLNLSQGDKVVAVGLHPSVLHYNHLPTLDGYISTAPLSRKYLWMDILAPELEKNSTLKNYIQNWGGRLYLFSDDVYRQTGLKTPQLYKGSDVTITTLDVRYDMLQENGVRYILSAVPIDTDQNRALRFVRKYNADESAWDIHLYAL